MQLSDLSVRRPVFAGVVALMLCIAGVIAFLRLSVREYPDTDPPVISIQTTYTGAAANVVESRVTEVLEEQLAGIEGIRSIVSRSQDGASRITVEFNPGRDIDAAANDVRDRVASAAEDLPEEILPPEIRKADADAQPILFLVVSKPGWSPLQISDYVDRDLVDRFSAIDGVARVFIGGEARPSMRIWLDPERLASRQLTPADIEEALRSQNVELPAGRLESHDANVSLRVERPYETPAQFADLVVGRGADGYQIRLGDVARIEQGAENPYQMFRLNGRPAVAIAIVRQSGSNTLQVSESAKKEMEAIKPNLPADMTMTVATDESLFISRAIEQVWHTLAEAAVLVVLVIFLFLGTWRATLIPAVTVPICLLCAFATLWAFGYSLNLLTLLAMVLAIGLVVDDAIVVLENIYHRIEQGEPPLVAAYRGSRQVGFAVISTTLVVCMVFVPVMFLAGQTGLLFRELSVAMIGAVAFSGFLALSLAPMLCSKLLRFEERSRFAKGIEHRFEQLETNYRRRLSWALDHAKVPVIVTLVFLTVAGVMFSFMQSELVPEEDVGIVFANLNAAEGTGFDAMVRNMIQVEKTIASVTKDGAVANVITRVPQTFGDTEDFNVGIASLLLKPWEQRDETTKDVVAEVNKALRKVPGVRGNAMARASFTGTGGSRSQPISFVIAGNSYADLMIARNRILAAAAANPGIINLDSDYKETKPQLRIVVNTQRLGDLGVSVTQVSEALQSLLGSRRVSTYVDRGQEYRVIVQAEASERATLGDLARIYVRSRSGQLIPLSNLVTTHEMAGPRDLGRYNKMRAITLSGGLAPGYTLGEALKFLEQQAAASPEVSAIGYLGQSQQFKETGSSIWLVFGLTIVIVFLVLAAQFESLIHPLVIITTVPLAVAGGVFGLAITGQTINLYSQIGIVMLVGLAAKNGILIVEFANQLRDEGRTIEDAVRIAAARRLRPILMTSIATVAGAIPLVIGSGAGAASRTAIGVVIVFGVAIATFITLFIVPILYQRLARYTGSPDAVGRELDQALREPGAGSV
jgi:multidrug efflux pump